MLRALYCALCFFAFTAYASENKKVAIAFVSDGPSVRLDGFESEFKQEISDLLIPEFDVVFLEEDFQGNWTLESIQEVVDRALKDPEVTMIVTIGPISSDLISHRKELSKPVIAPFIVDQSLQDLPHTEDDTSGVKNLNYLTFPSSVLRDLKVFGELAEIKTLAFVVDSGAIDALAGALERLVEYAKVLDLQVILVPADGSVDQLLERLPQEIDAVYLTALPRFSNENIDALAQGFINKRLSSFSLFAKGFVDQGILGSMSPDSDMERLARRVALNAQAVLLGENPENFTITVSDEQQLTVNAKTAYDLCLSLSWDVLLDARVIDEDKIPKGPTLSLIDAVEAGLSFNPNLASVWQEVLAGLEDVQIAKSRLMLQIDLNSFARIIDRDRAGARFGFEPQAAIYGTASASQMLYSNERIGDVRVQRYLQNARNENYQTNKLDLTFEVTRAYMNSLRTETLENIQKNNLKLTVSNLKTAERRVRVGVARLSEVYRWESQLADDRSNVVDAHFQTLSAEVILSRLMNRAQEGNLNLLQITIDEPYWLMKRQWVDKQLDTPRKLELFTQFSVWQGMLYSPEIKDLQERIYAQAEILGIRTRALWQPDFFLVGEVTDRFASGGAGRTLPPGVNTTDWFLGIDMSFPLFKGGEKIAEKRKACQELLRLRYLFGDLVNQIEEDVRVNVNRASSSFAAIKLAKDASWAARSNLDLVLEGYAKGTETILDLLDAQNQALNSDLLEANAIYDYLIDAAAVQRATGRFDFLMSPEEQKLWGKDLEAFMKGRENACVAK